MSALPADLVPEDFPHPIVLGIDPGTSRLGWGALVLAPAGPRFLACGVLAPPRRWGTGARLGRLLEDLEGLLATLRPARVALEGAFCAQIVQSALRLGEARGVVRACVARRGIELEEVAPAAAKKALVGNGQASKEQVAAMVGRVLRLDVAALQADATDALALAWTVAGRLALAARTAPPPAP